ncbi:MAG: S-methyl-5-thioribose-1-phosphate isomerase [Gammaproteobacteria bacterium]|nr:S-methyl-5-thioribose-1-phosphate isomerase [Gammaproteobacteria bacterium]
MSASTSEFSSNDGEVAVPGLPRVVEWRDDALYLLDQTRLPATVAIDALESAEAVRDAIRALKVRGAPAIGAAGAYGLCLAMAPYQQASPAEFLSQLDEQSAYLESARPTAVNLAWALRRLVRRVAGCGDLPSGRLWTELLDEARAIEAEDRALCAAIGRHGRSLIQPGVTVLTHCNAGALATCGLGTATAPLYLAHADGVPFRVLADETRPLLQGARLTSWELQTAGIDVTLITDNMAASMMANGEVDMVIVGTDRVAANGDVANKIGTLSVAIAAEFFGIPFYVACPYSTIDLATATGEEIPIEERDADEVRRFGGCRTAPVDAQVRNPAFDVTPARLVTAFITDRGIVTPPYEAALSALFNDDQVR